jgi:hypothetical protein
MMRKKCQNKDFSCENRQKNLAYVFERLFKTFLLFKALVVILN